MEICHRIYTLFYRVSDKSVCLSFYISCKCNHCRHAVLMDSALDIHGTTRERRLLVCRRGRLGEDRGWATVRDDGGPEVHCLPMPPAPPPPHTQTAIYNRRPEAGSYFVLCPSSPDNLVTLRLSLSCGP